jgi:hypothetical protein
MSFSRALTYFTIWKVFIKRTGAALTSSLGHAPDSAQNIVVPLLGFQLNKAGVPE